MLKRIPISEFCCDDEQSLHKTLRDIDFYYGLYKQDENNAVRIEGIRYEIRERGTMMLIGSVSDPLNTLVRNCMTKNKVDNIKRMAPDAVLYKFTGTESFLDSDQPNPQGMFVLKFEMALAFKHEEVGPVDYMETERKISEHGA
ncbi:MAG: hypothetical protein ACXAEU_00685 [Candidatus Hodarchaeales archaeon]|jgi:hypothetical protein